MSTLSLSKVEASGGQRLRGDVQWWGTRIKYDTT